MTVLERDRDLMSWKAHLKLSLFSTDDMRDAGFYVGPSLVFPDENYLGTQRILREPTMDEMLAVGLVPYEVREFEDNILVNGGIQRLGDLLIGAGGQSYINGHAALGVGDGAGSVPTAAATDTDMTAATGATHRYIQPTDSTFPSRSSNVLTFQATITSANGTFHWREWMIDQTTAGGTGAATATVLNHRGVDMGDFTGTSISKALQTTLTPS